MLDMAETPNLFIVDCGSDISIIKANRIKSTQIYYPDEKCNIIGIGHGSISTIGTTHTDLLVEGMKIPHKFHIVEDNFPIPTDGIIGRDFLVNYRCKINYESWLLEVIINCEALKIPIVNNRASTIVLPARCETIKRLNNIALTEDSVVFAQEISPGIFCANSIVNRNNCFVKFVNTTNNDFTLPIEFRPEHAPLATYTCCLTGEIPSDALRNQTLKSEIITQHLEPQIKERLESLCLEFNDIFSLQNDILTHNNFYEQNIQLENKKGVYIKNYRTPEIQKAEINAQVGRMLKEGIIQHSTSPYNSPILLVPKKSSLDEKKWRLVVDFRQLNKQIIPDKFPLPRIDEILDHLGRAKYFSTLDLKSGFHQIPLDEPSKRYTAFSTDKGHFEFNRLPFGLNISPNSFQRMMSIALSGLPPHCAFLYIDDIIVVGCSMNHHIANLRKVFQHLRKFNLKLNPAKCHFFKNEVTYLGHNISEKGIQPDKTKYSVISNYPVPKNSDEVRRFVAFCNYYRRFIRNFAELTSPLNKLLRKNTSFTWSEECNNSFNILKRKLTSPQVLQFPDYDKDFIIYTDASKVACGAVLAQTHDGVELPIAFASKAFTKGESNKSTIEQELTAIHWAINHFRPYIYGRKFIIRTDHRPLIYLFSLKNPSSKLTRMRWDLEEYNFEVEYIKGKENVLSDALSRIKITSETLKQMYVVTRSMTRSNATRLTDLPTQETDQLHVYETLSNLEAFDIPKLSFSYNSNQTCLNMVIYDKKFRKRITPTLSLAIGKPEIFKIGLEKILKFIDGRPADNTNRGTIFPKKLAIQTNDSLFNHVDMKLFKDIGNGILRNVTIIIYEKPVVVSNETQINNIIKQYHDSPIGGHLGINRLYKKLKSLYSWSNMKQTITEYVKSCSLCKTNKHHIPLKTQAIVTTTPNKPFDIVSIDTVGPFALTEKGNRYAVTMQCDLSKYVIAVPVPDKAATTIAKAVVDKCILVFGPMKCIKTDQGTEYKGVFDEVCKLLRIDHKCSTAYHPQTIGALERNHKCLNEYLRIFGNERQNDWDEWLMFYCFCYNTTPNIQHNFTPFELIFGKKLNTFEFCDKNQIDPLYNLDSYQKELKFRLQVTHNNVMKTINNEKIKRTNETNSKIVASDIGIGDIVYLQIENRHKLEPIYSGPYKVTKVSSSNAVITDSNNKHQEVHKTRLIRN